MKMMHMLSIRTKPLTLNPNPDICPPGLRSQYQRLVAQASERHAQPVATEAAGPSATETGQEGQRCLCCARLRVVYRCFAFARMHAHACVRARSCKEMVSYWWGRAGTRYKCIPARSGWSKLSLVRHDEAERHSTDMDARTHPAHLHDVRAVDVKRCRDHAEAQISRHDTRVSVICSTCPSVWRRQLKQDMISCEHRWFTIRW